MRKLQLVFFVVDADTKEVIGEKKCISLDINEDELRKADEADAVELKQANDLIGEHVANYMMHGRGKYLREMFQATGIMVGRYLDRSLSGTVYGSKHIALLEQAK